MAYNNGFPMSYQPMQIPYQQPQMIPQPQQQQQMQGSSSNPMIWVQGEAGAKSFLVAPNTTVPLWDSENQTVYIKSADASGMPQMKIIDYTIREANQQAPAIVSREESEPVDYVTHKELSAFEARIKKQIGKLTKGADEDE